MTPPETGEVEGFLGLAKLRVNAGSDIACGGEGLAVAGVSLSTRRQYTGSHLTRLRIGKR